MDQLVIALLGPMAFWYAQDARLAWRRWATVAGLLAQPFWFYAAWEAGQWGIFAIDVLYTAGWIKGFWMNWIKQ